MKDSSEPDALAQVRAAREQISQQFNHDPQKLVDHYITLQQAYKDRLVNSTLPKASPQTA